MSKHHRHKHKDLRIKRRSPPGASPGQVLPDPAFQPPQLRLMAYGGDQFSESTQVDLAKFKTIAAAHRVTWLDVEGLGDAKIIEQIGQTLGLHRLALEDVSNVHQRAKVEDYGESLFVVLRMVKCEERASTEQISMFIGPNWIVTLQEGSPGDPFDRVRKRIRDGVGKIRHSGPDYLAYALIDAVIDACYPVLEVYAERLDSLEDDCLLGREPNLFDRLHEVKADLLILRRAIWPQREAIAKLLLESTSQIQPETRIYLRDCYDHVVQVVELVETYRELIADLRDLHMSSISNRINETMRVLTIISTLFIPLTFIAGVYGMNFDTRSPYNMPELTWKFGYFGCLALMIACTVGMLSFFIRKGWIGRKFLKALLATEPPEPV